MDMETETRRIRVINTDIGETIGEIRIENGKIEVIGKAYVRHFDSGVIGVRFSNLTIYIAKSGIYAAFADIVRKVDREVRIGRYKVAIL